MSDTVHITGKKASVFVAIPHRDGLCQGTVMACFKAQRDGNRNVHDFRFASSSLLTQNFNKLWCEALNERHKGITHFCMMHADQLPEPWWLDALLAEFAKSGADILSCVVPIKDSRGLTSTAVLDPRTMKMRRLCMREIVRMPTTFDAAGAGFPGQHLLINTGLWICDFTRPWVEQICFTCLDQNLRNPDGTWTTQCYSEDWNLSVDAMRLGLKVHATRAIKLHHRGEFDFPNFVPWGEWQTDQLEENYWRPARAEKRPAYQAVQQAMRKQALQPELVETAP